MGKITILSGVLILAVSSISTFFGQDPFGEDVSKKNVETISQPGSKEPGWRELVNEIRLMKNEINSMKTVLGDKLDTQILNQGIMVNGQNLIKDSIDDGFAEMELANQKRHEALVYLLENQVIKVSINGKEIDVNDIGNAFLESYGELGQERDIANSQVDWVHSPSHFSSGFWVNSPGTKNPLTEVELRSLPVPDGYVVGTSAIMPSQSHFQQQVTSQPVTGNEYVAPVQIVPNQTIYPEPAYPPAQSCPTCPSGATTCPNCPTSPTTENESIGGSNTRPSAIKSSRLDTRI